MSSSSSPFVYRRIPLPSLDLERQVPTYGSAAMTLGGNDEVGGVERQIPTYRFAAIALTFTDSESDDEVGVERQAGATGGSDPPPSVYVDEHEIRDPNYRNGRRSRRVGDPGPPVRNGPPADLRALQLQGQSAAVRNRDPVGIPILPPIRVRAVNDERRNDTPVKEDHPIIPHFRTDVNQADYYLKPYADVQKRKLGQVALDVAKCIKCSRIHYKKMFCCSQISQHIMCYECFNKPRLDEKQYWRSLCSYCGDDVHVREFDFRVMKFTELRCEYFDHGCKEVLSEATFGEHIKSCSKNPNTN